MSLQQYLGVKLPVKITLLTPLHIGSGESLSPYSDYVLDEQRNVCLLDNDKLGSLMYEQQQINHYIKDVLATQTENKENVLKQFIQHDLKGNMAQLMNGQVLEGHGIENPILIDRCITTDGEAYLPGSSIKGAIRTALLHHWLCSGSYESKVAIDSFISQLTEFDRRKDLSNQKLFSATEKAFTELVEEAFFGRLKQKERLPMSCFRITDTAPCRFDQRSAWQAERMNLKNAESSKYSIKECISPGTEFNTTICIDFYQNRRHHPILEAVSNKKGLFNILYQYAYDHIEHEWMILGTIDEKIQQGALSAYDTYISNLKSEIENSDESIGYLRLGAGKMQLYQTVGNALYKHVGNDDNHPSWCLYIDYLAKFKEIDRYTYPITRVLAAGSQMPFGWAKLS